jgi:predicted nuclease of predicted toxin-antitoxin system
MRIYIDEDLAAPLLVRLLVKAGHDVETPAATGLLSRSDPVQLGYAIRDQRTLPTRNYKDFEELHDLIRDAQGHHFGILVVRRDNDPTRDLNPKGVVNAIRKIEAANATVRDEYTVLNQWR